MATIVIKTDPEWSWLTNRNAHCINLKEVWISTIFDSEVIHIDGVSKAGRLLTGGLSLDRAAWENLVLEYIKQEADGEFWERLYKLIQPKQGE
jgi:hypothetical protein